MRNRLAALFVALVLASLSPVPAARAADVFPPGTTGYDISFPECSLPGPVLPFSFAVVGATGGKAFTQNPCLASEYARASLSGRQPALYMNMKSPVGTSADQALSGPRGVCVLNDQACLAYNFGYKTAQDAVAYAASQRVTASSWWLDIETMSSWSTDTAMNAIVIGGAIDFLKSQGATIGIYSSQSQWAEIAGSYSPGLPVWVTTAPNAAEAPNYCPRSFGGGQVLLVQYIAAPYDADYACTAADRAIVVTSPALGPTGSKATVVTDGDCLNVRPQAGFAGNTLGCLPSGSVVTLLDGSSVVDGYRWQLITSGSTTGWVAAVYLRAGIVTPIPTATPTSPANTGTFAAKPVFGASGLSLAVFNGGTVDQLEAATLAAGGTGAWAQDARGAYQLLIVRGPAFANAAFRSAFPGGFTTTAAVTLTR